MIFRETINTVTINVLLILQVRDISFFYAGKTLNGAFREDVDGY